ncbi:hypothetical protein MTP99_013003 [Tenebrio molitor]|nr:hypothetical protein MTP99_013003 [Tenebrio molitor]KAJ3631901.1 hypothetical protein MTP99_013003 [Tenebrio molitor]
MHKSQLTELSYTAVVKPNMLIQQNNNVDKRSELSKQNMNVKSNKTTKLSEKCVVVKSFYNKHFPTDRRTYNWRVPFVGLVLSILSMHFVTTEFAIRWYMSNRENHILLHLYVFVSAALSYELHYGLKIGDRKQYTPWLLLKLVEIFLTLATIIYILVDHPWHLNISAPLIIYGIVVSILNGLTTYIVGSTSLKQLRGHLAKENVDVNIYDNVDNI